MNEDAHSRPSGDASGPLYDLNIPTPTHAERARTLVAQFSTGTLCTLALEPEGYPYGSFVTVAFANGDPVFLADLWPSPQDIAETMAAAIGRDMFSQSYADVYTGDEAWRELPAPTGELYDWDPASTYVRQPPYFEGMADRIQNQPG